MANIIRLCHPADFRLMIEFDGTTFKGRMGPFIENILDDLRRKANVTLNVRSKDDGIGEPIEGTNGRIYSGCIGLIQQNLSDAMLQVVNYPLPAINLTQGLLMMDSALQFVNSYNTSEGKPAQIESLFESFTPQVWIFSFLLLITCVSCLFIHGRFEKSLNHLFKRPFIVSTDKYLTYHVATHMTRFGQLDESTGSLRKIIFLILSFFSFMVIFYLSSFMKTELVVVPAPITMRSYSEMLQRGCGVWFFRGADAYQFFKSAADGSERKRLWDWSISKYPEDLIIFDGNEKKAALVLNALIMGKLAFVTESLWMTPIIKEFCALSVDEERNKQMRSLFNFKSFKKGSLFPVVSQDEKATSFLKAFVANQYTSSALNRLGMTFHRIFESGLPAAMIKNVADTDFMDSMLSLPRTKGTYGQILNCVQNIIFMPENHMERLSFSNISNLPRIFSFIIVYCLFVLLLELCMSNYGF